MALQKPVEEERIERGRERLESIAGQRDEAWEFFRGNHFAEVNEKGILQFLATVTSVSGRGKPRWRARQKRNLIFDVVLREASALTKRVPSFQVTASTTDPEDIGAARLSEKVSLYGYEQWSLREAAQDAVIHSIIAGESFAWVYFDNTVGPFIGDEQGNVGLGEVCVRIYGANECYWEPGLRFEQSPWHVVEQARTIEQVTGIPGYTGPKKLTPDADSRALANRGKGRSGKPKLVLVTEYLELPSPKNPQGRWLTLANKKQILPERPYPGRGDRPILRKLAYAPDPDNDRDLGLVPQLLDAQRTFNDSNNKAVEWKNMALMPQWAAHPGVLRKQRRTDEPGKVYEIPDPARNLQVLTPPAVPRELFEMGDRAQRDIDRIAAQGANDASQFESGKEAQVFDANAEDRKAMFIADLAGWWSGVMHDGLTQVQDHYTEPRLLQIRGRFGPEPLEDFKGADLRSQVDVHVDPDSIQPRTKMWAQQKLQYIIQVFPGAFAPEEILSAMNSGKAEALLDSFELAKARANTVIQRIKDGSFLNAPMRPVMTGEDPGPKIDPETGQPIPVMGPDGPVMDPGEPQQVPGPDGVPITVPGEPVPRFVQETEVPEWMPRPFDNIAVHKKQMETWMQTSDWDALDVGGKEAANLYYDTLLQLEAKQAQRQAEIQNAMAEGQGLANAAAPQGPKPMPSLPTLNGNTASGGPEPQKTPGQ